MKSANDGLWTEQRMWLRSLLEVGYLHYPNPYLFDAEGEALVKISICKVVDPKLSHVTLPIK